MQALLRARIQKKSGDKFITFDDGFVAQKSVGYVYGFLTNKNLSAGLFSNSEAEDDLRVIMNSGADTMSLTSAQWYYEAGDKGGQAQAATYDYPLSELPYAKVCIAEDVNEDKTIDWQDAAVAYRDIINVPYGSEDVKDLVNYRIVMNWKRCNKPVFGDSGQYQESCFGNRRTSAGCYAERLRK